MSFALLVMRGVCDTAPDGGMDAGRVEPLREQVPVHPPHGRRFLERHVGPQPPAERLFDHFVLVEVPEDLP